MITTDMTERQKRQLWQQTYQMGRKAAGSGKTTNPFSYTDMLEYCAWAAGYHDYKRGYHHEQNQISC